MHSSELPRWLLKKIIKDAGLDEERFRALFAEVTLPEGVAPGLARLFLLGALNWTPVWHRPGRAPIREIARQLLAPLRASGERA